MTERIAAVIEQRQTDIINDLRERLRNKLSEPGSELAGGAEWLIAECAHVVADLPLVLREGPSAVKHHDHDREMPTLRSLGAGALDGELSTRVLFETHVLLRSRIMADVLSNLPAGLPPRETQNARTLLYRTIDDLLGSSPCDFAFAVEKRLRAQRDELAWLARRTLAAQEEERRRIAMNVHDALSPAVSAALFQVQASLARLQGGDPGIGGELEAAQAALERCLADMRQVVLDLRPPVLDAYGLAEAVRDCAARCAREYGLQVNISDGVYERARLSPDQEGALFRIAQEAITNAALHARASSLTVRISGEEATLLLEVSDDGVGFDVEHVLAHVVEDQHLGLLAMRERAQLLGGQLQIVSRPGEGTAVSVRVPRRAQEV